MAVPADRSGGAHLRRAAGGHLSAAPFPFAAIVGQERLTQALLLNAVNHAVGGVLVRGPSGTGKSTAVRGLAELLPEIEVVAGCPFGCDPARPACADCRSRSISGERLPAHRRRRPIVDLPLNATEERVAGSIDIARALTEGEKALEPGLLAEANRGILYVDEINLLDDHLADILLDAAALGVNIVEREGVSAAHPARFLLVGTMNPEEGELRPQISDRIGLHVDVPALREPTARAEVMRRREAFGRDPGAFAAAWAEPQSELRGRLERAGDLLERMRVPEHFYTAIGSLVTRLGVSSHRADIAVLECAKGLAALDGRPVVAVEDVRRAAELALGHRLVGDPFSPEPTLQPAAVERALSQALEEEMAAGKAAPATERTAAAPPSPARP
jgi:Mg-chelatase subunit ChlI